MDLGLPLQAGQTADVSNAALVYASEAIYKLIMKPTNSLVNLVVANQTFVDDRSGVALRTVELSIVRVSQPACSIGVSKFLFISSAQQACHSSSCFTEVYFRHILGLSCSLGIIWVCNFTIAVLLRGIAIKRN